MRIQPATHCSSMLHRCILFLSFSVLFRTTNGGCSPLFPNSASNISLGASCYFLATGSLPLIISQDTDVVGHGAAVDFQNQVHAVVLQAASLSVSNAVLLNVILFPPPPLGGPNATWPAPAAIGFLPSGAVSLQNCIISTTCSALATWTSYIGPALSTAIDSRTTFIARYSTPQVRLQSVTAVCTPSYAPTATVGVGSADQLQELVSAVSPLNMAAIFSISQPGISLDGWTTPTANLTTTSLSGDKDTGCVLDLASVPLLFNMGQDATLALDNLKLVNGCVQFQSGLLYNTGQLLALMSTMASVQFPVSSRWGEGGKLVDE